MKGQQALDITEDPFLIERTKVLVAAESTTTERLTAAVQIVATTLGPPGMGDPHLMGYRGETIGERLAVLLDQYGYELQPRTGGHA